MRESESLAIQVNIAGHKGARVGFATGGQCEVDSEAAASKGTRELSGLCCRQPLPLKQYILAACYPLICLRFSALPTNCRQVADLSCCNWLLGWLSVRSVDRIGDANSQASSDKPPAPSGSQTVNNTYNSIAIINAAGGKQN